MSWFGRLWSRFARGSSGECTAIYWGDHLWLVQPPREREGVVSGKLRRTRARTWAGSDITVDEHHAYTELLALELGDGVYAPLKPAPTDPAALEALRGTVAAWQPGSSGPPFEQPEHGWLGVDELERRGWALDTPLETRALCYPMFSAGTIVPFRIWGFYVLDAPA